MGETVKAPDGKTWVVRRLLLPAPVSAANLVGAASKSSDSSSSSPLVALLVRVIILAVIGLALLPFAVLFRLVFRRWTVEAEQGDTTLRWKAKSWGAAGAGVKALSTALEQGKSLEEPIAGLTRLQ